MRFANPLIGRLAALLASILVVGTATAADVLSPEPALATMSPATHSALRHSDVMATQGTDEVAFESAAPASGVPGIGPAIGIDALDEFRGGADVDNTVLIDGRVNNNTADRIVSGSNVIQDGAFANANGISTVIQNSGSNVLIQNGMVVTVQFADPGL